MSGLGWVGGGGRGGAGCRWYVVCYPPTDPLLTCYLLHESDVLDGLVDGGSVFKPVPTRHILQLQHRLEHARVDVRALDVDLGARSDSLILE